MSWLLPLFLTGAMFASSGSPDLPNINFKHESAEKNVRAQQEETERFEQTYPLSATGKVSVSNVNGSITIDVWDGAQVKFEYVKTADTRERLAEVEVKIDARQDAFNVETNFDKWKENGGRGNRNNRFDVQYHLTVPRTAILDGIETVNGAVNIREAGNLTKASTVNGTVSATNLRGAAADLSTVNGAVNAEFDALQAGSRISLNAVNGQVSLTIPSDASATVKADSLNGNITNDFNLPVRKGEYVGRDLYGKIGAGDARIKLSSVNGDLSLKRKNDGKTPSAATSLLSNKSYDEDDDWDNDEDGGGSRHVKTPRPPRPPRPAAAPNSPPAPGVVIDNEMIRKSVEDAQKELSKIQPELAKINADAMRQAAAQINSTEMQAQLKAARETYKDAMAQMTNAYFGAPRVEAQTETFTVKDKPRVTVEAKNCDVTVRGWDKQEVKYSLVKISRASGSTTSNVSVKNTEREVNIKVASETSESGSGGKYVEAPKMRLEIFVPVKSDLKIKTDEQIRLEGVSGEMDLQGDDGAINVRDADGKLSVGTSDGAIRVIGFRGAFDGRTDDGTMNLEGDFDSLNAVAADGTIVLTVPENANAIFESDREIESDGVNLVRENEREKIWRVGQGGTTYRLSASEGRIIVRAASALKTNL